MDAWNIIKSRPDLYFLIPTKRIERFTECIPNDWKDGYDNVIISVSAENNEKANERIPILLNIKAKKKFIFVAPILEYVDLKKYLSTGKIDQVSVGGESYENARLCDFEWVKKIKEDCEKYNVEFDFHQTGSNFKMNNKIYKINHFDEYSQAKKGMEYLNKINNK